MSTINQGLLITVIGMALVFLMIVILWGIMALLVKLTNKPEVEEESITEDILIGPDKSLSTDQNGRLAAAIAVAYALESQASDSGFIPRPSVSASSENAWWTAGRTQQLYSNTIRGRNR